MSDVWVMLASRLLGYGLRTDRFGGAPPMLALVLGPALEVSRRQPRIMFKGDRSVVIGRPASAALLLLALALVLMPLARHLAGCRAEIACAASVAPA